MKQNNNNQPSYTKFTNRRTCVRILVFLMVEAIWLHRIGFSQQIDNLNSREPQTYGFIVGISKYKSLGKLHYADSDARLFAQYLRSKSGGGAMKKNIITFYNDSAQMGEIWESITTYVQKMKSMFQKGDRLYFYFSGHGGSFDDRQESKSYFFLYDSPSGTDGGTNLSIKLLKTQIEALLEGSPVQVVLIFDACRTSSIRSNAGQEKVNKLLNNSSGEILLVASKGGFEARESHLKQHGIFTYFLLKGLLGDADGSNDGAITGHELDVYLRKNVNDHCQLEYQSDQIPTLVWGNDDQLVTEKFAIYRKEDADKLLKNLEPSVSQKNVDQEKYATSKSVFFSAGDLSVEASLLESINDNRLTEPEGNNAIYYYRQLVKDSAGHNSTLDLDSIRSLLAVKLINSANLVVSEDLDGRRNYLRKIATVDVPEHASPMQTSTSEINLNYYRQALSFLNAYREITLPEFQNPSINSMMAYIGARDATIRPTSRRESKRRLNEISVQIRRDKNMAFLHQGKGMLLSEMGAKKKSIISFHKAFLLAPRWSYPAISLAQTFEEIGSPKKSEYYLKTVVKRSNSFDFEASCVYGNYLYNRRILDSAEFYYRRSLQVNPNYISAILGRGNVNRDLRKYDSALVFFYRAVKLNPKSDKAIESLGIIKKSIGDIDSAIIYYRRLINLGGQHDFAFNSMGNLMFEVGQYDSADQFYSKAYALNRRDYAINTNLALTKNMIGQKDSSSYFLEKAIHLVPKDNPYLTGSIYSLVSRYDSATKIFKKIYENDKSSYNALDELAAIKNKIGETDSAKYYYRKSMRIYPGSPIALNELGNLEFNQKRYDSADFFYRRAIGLEHEYTFLYINIASSKFKQGQFDSSLYFFHKALNMVPNASNVLTSVGDIHLQLKHYDKSNYYYVRALASNHNNKAALLGLAELNKRTKDFDSAQYYYERILSIDPNNYSIYALLASLMNDKQAFDSVAIYARKALSYNLKPDEFYALLSHAKRKLFQHDSAVFFAKKAIQFNDDSEAAFISLGLAYHSHGQFDSALFLYRNVIRKNPASNALINLGLLKFESEQYDSSNHFYMQAYKFTPNQVRLNFHLGNLKLVLGQIDSADFFYRKSLKLEPSQLEGILGKLAISKKRNQIDSVKYFFDRAMSSKKGSSMDYAFGSIYDYLNRHDSAIYRFQRVFNAENDALTILKLGNQKYNVGQFDSAIYYHQKFSSMSKNTAFSDIKLGYDYLGRRDFELADYFFERHHKKDPYNWHGNYQYNKASLLLAKGLKSAAFKALESSIVSGQISVGDICLDKNLRTICSLPEFKSLVTKLRKRDRLN